MKNLRVDICVLGASSPTGLALTGLLARAGVDPLAISRRTGLINAQRAHNTGLIPMS